MESLWNYFIWNANQGPPSLCAVPKTNMAFNITCDGLGTWQKCAKRHLKVQSVIPIQYTCWTPWSSSCLFCVCALKKTQVLYMGNKQSGSDPAINNYSQSTRCFSSMEKRGVIWLTIELKYQNFADYAFKCLLASDLVVKVRGTYRQREVREGKFTRTQFKPAFMWRDSKTNLHIFCVVLGHMKTFWGKAFPPQTLLLYLVMVYGRRTGQAVALSY